MRPKIFDMLFHDDRMFVLEISSVESRDATFAVLNTSGDSPGSSETEAWAVVTRRNVPGYPPHRVDHFFKKDEAIAFYKRVVVQTPRTSLGQKPPHPLPTLDEYTSWLVSESLFDPLLNRIGHRKYKSSPPSD